MNRITQKEIARALGLHVSTVSKALKGDPAIAVSTVKTVREKAKELGFVPDPMLSALSAYRRRLRPESYHGTLAWIFNHAQDCPMDHFSGYADYRLGAEQRAQELGYRLDSFWVDDRPGALRTLQRMLKTRGIHGVMLAPQATPGKDMALDWEALAAVGIGYTLPEPRLDRVTNDHFATMTELVSRLREHGCRRIGCYLWEEDNLRMGKRAQSAFLTLTRQECREVCTYRDFKGEAFRSWIRQHQLDAVICRGREQLEVLRRAGVRIPGELGLAGYALAETETELSGMYHNNRQIGAAAAEWVISKLERGQTGLPSSPRRLLVSSVWLENKSLKTVSVSA